MKVKLSQHIILSTLVITSSPFSLLGITDCRKKQMSVKDAYIQYVQRHLVPWVTANVLTHAFINVSFYFVCVYCMCNSEDILARTLSLLISRGFLVI